MHRFNQQHVDILQISSDRSVNMRLLLHTRWASHRHTDRVHLERECLPVSECLNLGVLLRAPLPAHAVHPEQDSGLQVAPISCADEWSRQRKNCSRLTMVHGCMICSIVATMLLVAAGTACRASSRGCLHAKYIRYTIVL